ncbi:MAG: hypothetical protein AAFN27_16880 [Pseudomonadota bacterium]
MAVEGDGAHALPSWFVAPGEVDSFAWLALGMLFLALYGVGTSAAQTSFRQTSQEHTWIDGAECRPHACKAVSSFNSCGMRALHGG